MSNIHYLKHPQPAAHLEAAAATRPDSGDAGERSGFRPRFLPRKARGPRWFPLLGMLLLGALALNHFL